MAPSQQSSGPVDLQTIFNLHQDGKLDEAETLYLQLLKKEPKNPDALRLLGILYLHKFDPEKAVPWFKKAIAQMPGFAEAWSNLGTALKDLKRYDEAEKNFLKAIALNPSFTAAYYNLGNVRRELGKQEEAEESYYQALALNGEYVNALYSLGTLLNEKGRHKEALARLDRAVALDPSHSDAWNARGDVCQKLGKMAERIASYEKALAAKADHSEAFGNLVWSRQEICDWGKRDDDLKALGELIDTALGKGEASPIDPFAALILNDSRERQRSIARSFSKKAEDWAQEKRQEKKNKNRLRFSYPGEEGEKIRVGYLSADFHDHATAHLMRSMFALHDREKFEITAYSYGIDDKSAARAAIARDCDHFVDLASLTDEDSAIRINDDGIHILVDLKGFTENQRLGILALKPAPVQIDYLGFPGSMQAEFIDYAVVDHWVVGSENESDFLEKLIYMPHSYQVNDHLREKATAGILTRDDAGLPEDAFVFCCFNNSFKITPDIFDVWMRILGAVPGSVFWLLGPSEEARENMRREAEARGIQASRIIFANRASHGVHLARHHLADLFLDSPLYNAHTTASDALFEGLPVLTYPGAAFAQRVGASLVCAAGLGEMVMENVSAYEKRAIELAGNSDELRTIREKLIAGLATCPLYDTLLFTRDLERGYGKAWDIYLAGGKPQHIDLLPGD